MSRTGKISLRAQTRARGFNFTVNTRHGFRVSRRIAKGTQVALQNGNFRLRGRYALGAWNLNLAKRGLSISRKNRLGTFNWSNPNRSSAKIGGIQVRGDTAVAWHFMYFALLLIYYAVCIGYALVLVLISVVYAILCSVAFALTAAVTFLARGTVGGWRKIHLHRQRKHLDSVRSILLSNQTVIERDLWLAMYFGLLFFRGRGTADADATALDDVAAKVRAAAPPQILRQLPAPSDISLGLEVLDSVYSRTDHNFHHCSLLLGSLLAEAIARNLPPADVLELFLALDQAVVDAGCRTRLQEEILTAYANTNGIEIVPETGE